MANMAGELKNVPEVFSTDKDPKVPFPANDAGRTHSTALSSARSDAVLLPGDHEHGGQPPEFDLDAAIAKLPPWRQQITW